MAGSGRVVDGAILINLVPRAMPVRGLGWHWLWGNGMICVRFHTRSLNAHARTDCIIYYTQFAFEICKIDGWFLNKKVFFH